MWTKASPSVINDEWKMSWQEGGLIVMRDLNLWERIVYYPRISRRKRILGPIVKKEGVVK